MNEIVAVMLKPLCACLMLTGMHAFLGLHVLRRGVIFVDLALAQTAALGATCGYVLGYGLHSLPTYLIALSFTLVAAALFAASRADSSHNAQEAYIGVIYAVTAAASIIVLSKSPQGSEEIKSLFVGHLLFVNWDEIRNMLLLYAGAGLAHWLLRKPIMTISESAQSAKDSGYRLKLWDFIFYALFGLIVASSLKLRVFSWSSRF